jgi:predicted Zn-dependent protease
LSKGDMVIASAGRMSRRTPRNPAPKVDMLQLDAVAPGNTRIQPNGMPISTGDYSQSIYHESSGGVLRWRKLPIKVYLKPGEPEVAVSAQSLQAWKSAFSVEMVPSSTQADVIVTWDKPSWDMDTMGLLNRPVVQVDEARNIRTVILISLYPLKGQSAANQLHAVSHELGHAFGLWGHSDNPGDIMYPALKQEMNDYPVRWSWRSAATQPNAQPSGYSEDFHPSQRDMNTLLKVYDLPLIDLSTYSPY